MDPPAAVIRMSSVQKITDDLDAHMFGDWGARDVVGDDETREKELGFDEKERERGEERLYVGMKTDVNAGFDFGVSQIGQNVRESTGCLEIVPFKEQNARTIGPPYSEAQCPSSVCSCL